MKWGIPVRCRGWVQGGGEMMILDHLEVHDGLYRLPPPPGGPGGRGGGYWKIFYIKFNL